MHKKLFLILSFLCLYGFAFEANSTNSFLPSSQHVLLAEEIIEKLETNHLIKKDYTSVKAEILEVYVDRLDPNKTIFTDLQVLEFLNNTEKSESLEDDLESAFGLFNLYASTYRARYDTQLKFLNLIQEENLKDTRKLRRDLSNAERLNNQEELRDLWVDLSTNDVIQLMLSGNTLEESVSKTKKRMSNQLNYFSQTRNEDVFNIFVNSIAAVYGPHTAYMSPKNSEDFDINMSLSLEGIGALLASDGLYTSISSLVPGGPAEKTDMLKPEDKIVGVGQDDTGEIVDVVGWRIDDVVDLIRGPKGSKVRLEIIPSSALNDSETEEVLIVRNVVKLEDQAAEKKIITLERDTKDYKVGVIELPAFYFDFDAYQKRDYNYKSSSKDVKRLIKELNKENIDGLIVDLRNNGGGSLYEANALAHLFLGRGTTVQVKSSNGNIQGLGERWGYRFFDKPLVVLVNKFSASASEILAGAIQDYDRGLVVGTSTFGKGTVQRVDPLTAGQIKFTESKFYRVSGSSNQKIGIQPDITLPSQFNVEELGESNYERALDHDSIPGIAYKDFNRVSHYKNQLKARSSKRINQSALFESIKFRKQWREDNQNEFLDLNLEERIKQKNKIEEFLLSNENNLRKKLNLPTFSSYKEFMDSDDDPDQLNVESEILGEAANILIDLIEIKNEPVFALNDKAYTQ